jgi:YVTN family beta-propeller protein
MRKNLLFLVTGSMISLLMLVTCNKIGDIQLQDKNLLLKSELNSVKPSDGLVSWWSAEGNANDKFGNNNGTEMNGATYAPGFVGQAFSFDGIDDYIKVPKSANLDVGGQVTIQFWMKSNANNFSSCCQGLVTTDFYAIEGGSGPYFYISDNSGQNFHHTRDINQSVPINDGVWYHLAGTYDGTYLQFYVNGLPWGNPLSYPGTISPMLENSFLAIGSEDGRTTCNFCINTRYFNGLIDEVGIYNRALTSQEINSLYTNTIALNIKPLNITPELAYICSGEFVEILDLPSLKFIGQIEIPAGGARMIEIIKSKRIACVTQNLGVSKIDLTTNTIMSTLNFPDNLQTSDIAVTPDGKTAFVTLFYTNSVAVINVDTWKVIKTIPLTNMNNYPNGIEMGQGGQYVFVANQVSGTVQVIDVKNLVVIKELETNTDGVNELALTPGGQNIFCTAYNQNRVVVIDSKKISVVKYIDLQHKPTGIDITKNGKTAFVTGSGATSGLSQIDTKTFTVLNVTNQMWGSRIRINSNDKLAIVTTPGQRQIQIFKLDDLSLISVLNVNGNSPFGVDFYAGSN